MTSSRLQQAMNEYQYKQQEMEGKGYHPRTTPEQYTIAEQNKQLFKQAMELEKKDRLIAGIGEELVSERAKLRKAHQELQQLQDETCLEVDEMQDIIYNQQEHIKGLKAELAQADYILKDQGNALAQLSEIKRHLSDVYDKNRRLCLDLENAEKAAKENDEGRLYQINNIRQQLRDWQASEIEAQQAAATQRAIADNAMNRAARAEQANLNLLDQLQAAEAKLEWYTRHCGTIEHLEKAIQFANECREKYW
jgi:hypothetical protein